MEDYPEIGGKYGPAKPPQSGCKKCEVRKMRITKLERELRQACELLREARQWFGDNLFQHKKVNDFLGRVKM